MFAILCDEKPVIICIGWFKGYAGEAKANVSHSDNEMSSREMGHVLVQSFQMHIPCSVGQPIVFHVVRKPFPGDQKSDSGAIWFSSSSVILRHQCFCIFCVETSTPKTTQQFCVVVVTTTVFGGTAPTSDKYKNSSLPTILEEFGACTVPCHPRQHKANSNV